METLTLMRNAASMVTNTVSMRLEWLRRLLDPRRDIGAECGHPVVLTIDDYSSAYERGDIACRVVDLWPNECWKRNPEIFESDDEVETEFEKAWEALNKKHNINALVYRADKLSGIGRFGIILIGVSDGKPLDQPLDVVVNAVPKPGQKEPAAPAEQGKLELLYFRPLDEAMVRVSAVEQSVNHPRYGQPTMYQIQFQNNHETQAGDVFSTSSQNVHWSRIIHLADNRRQSEVYGRPRMRVCFNRLLDLAKITGGSGEMFWKGGFPGLSLETNPEILSNVKFDVEATKEQMEAYMNGLQRYIATIGMNVKSLSVEVADPGPHIEAQMRMIAIALDVPWRVFQGSEAAQLASEQDSLNWNERVKKRQDDYVSPFVLRPVIDRFIVLGLLPAPKDQDQGYKIEWPDLNTRTAKEEAQIAQQKTAAITAYVSSGADQFIPPFHFLTLVLNFTDDEAHAIIDSAEAGDSLPTDHPAVQPSPMDQARMDAMAKAANQPPAGRGAPPKPSFARNGG